MSDNKLIYYGILFYYIYIQIYGILSNLLISFVLIMQWSVLLIPLFLLLFIVLLSTLFCQIRKFPKIRVWFILLILFTSIAVTFFNIPSRFYLLGENSPYNAKIQTTILDYISYSRALNTIVFLAISYFKYIKLKK